MKSVDSDSTVAYNDFMMMTVYHRTVSGRDEARFPKDFKKVAQVEGNSLDDAFQYTNHIDSLWTSNRDQVKLVFNDFGRGHRSTSVGDLIYLEDNGTWWLVKNVGFEEIIDLTIPFNAVIDMF